MSYVDIVFDGPPGPESGRFIEVEDDQRRSINLGEWVRRDDGYWALRIAYYKLTEELVALLREAQKELRHHDCLPCPGNCDGCIISERIDRALEGK
jgi:hypothetical protein